MISTVYYPNLFPSESWLRLAALCWDEVYTLHYQWNPKFPDEITKFNNQLGNFIIPKNTVELGSNPAVSEKFKALVSQFLRRKIKIPKSWEAAIDVDWYEMFGDKFPRDILDELKEVLVRDDDSAKVFLPNEVSLHYMSLCASQLADQEKADLFADTKVFARTAMFDKRVRGRITTSIMEAYIG